MMFTEWRKHKKRFCLFDDLDDEIQDKIDVF